MQIDLVHKRAGGRSAAARERVFRTLREILEAGESAALTVEEIAARAGVHKTTIYRRWLSTEGLIADLLVSLTPLSTPLPDSGDLCRDLEEIALRVAATLASPMAQQIQAMAAGTNDERLQQAAAHYWSSLLLHTATVVRRAQERGQATAEIDALAAIESLLGPIHFRASIAHQPYDEAELRSLAARTARMLRP